MERKIQHSLWHGTSTRASRDNRRVKILAGVSKTGKGSSGSREWDSFVSPSGVRSIWLRHDLQTFAKRLKALEVRLAQAPGHVLTESQVRAMDKAKQEKEAHGEIETAHPGYLGAQDSYYVGTIKSIGRICQQTFIDTYIKVAFAKLDDSRNALVARIC